MSQEKDTQTPYFPVTLILFKDMSSKKLSPSAQTVLLYIVRHTVGWQHGNERQRWIRLKVQDFIQGRPTSSGTGKYDDGTPLSVPATVMAALEECGVKGFIFELDHGRKDGYYSFGLQWKYYASYEAVSEQQAALAPTSNYRYKRVEGKDQFTEKPAEDQRPHYYGVIHGRPRRKSKSGKNDGQSSSIIEKDNSTIEDPLQKSKSSSSIIEEEEGLEAAPEAISTPSDRKGIESKLIDSEIESSVANATGAPASRRADDDIKQDQEKESMRRLLLAEKAKWEGITERDANWGEARRELRRLNRLLEELEG